jgi:hypothetical protein
MIRYACYAGAFSLLMVLSTGGARLRAAEASPAASEAPSFINDIEPLLTRYGCNSGGCHGKLAGQNGFRLSLRGYAPEQDFTYLVREEHLRRVNVADPESSLLLLKPTGKLPHAGGKVLEANSPAYATLLRWVQAGAPGPQADEKRIARLEVQPRAVSLVPGQQQPLTVKAFYTDGSERDVTWLAKFHSNDAGIASVSAEGNVTALRHGEVSAVVAFDGLVDTTVLTIPYPLETNPQWYAARNNVIDEHVMNKLAALKLEPSDPCDDATFLRRAMLDCIGTLPTSDEVRAFLADPRSDKRARLVESLLERPEFVDYWTLQLGDLLQNRKERDHDVRGVKGVRSLHAWLRTQVAANRPWSEIARDVLTARGTTRENPAVGYFVVTVGERQAHESEVGDSVAQAFLGTRIGCAKCHNHPLEKYTQDDYYHFIAFFSRVVLERKEPKDGPTTLKLGTQHSLNLAREIERLEKETQKVRAENGDPKKIEENEKRIAQLQEEIAKHLAEMPRVSQPRTGKPIPPQPLDRRDLGIEGNGDPREKLVQWMVDPSNELFAGAMVNRLWRHFFAAGLVEPVDDLRATNPPSNRDLWQAMSREFVGSNYNLKHMMRLILTSRTYQLSAETKPSNVTDTRFYSHYYARRLPAEVMLDALSQATQSWENFQGYPQGVRAIQLPGPQIDSYFLTTFGRSDRVTACACERNGDVTLSQLLHLQNSESVQNKVASGDGRLQKLLSESTDDDRLIEELYLNTFSRLPRDDERQAVKGAFQGADRQEVATDLFWALLNAKEFAFNR